MQEAMASAAGQWETMSDSEKAEVLPKRSTDHDLAAVACNTHKETATDIAKLAKTAGVLCSCLSSGVVVAIREIFGCESLSQRYLFVADVVHLYPETKLIVHDDACHLHKFAERRSDLSLHAAAIAPPQMLYAGDPFHMVGHIDAWCLARCNPSAPHIAPTMAGIRSSVCEFTFTWLSAYKHQSKHMSQWGFKFFLQEMIRSHNNSIFEGCL